MVEEVPGMETALVQREQIELLVDGVKDYAIFLVDSRGCVLSWNDGAAQLFGYPAAEVIGHSYSRLFTPEDVERGWPESEMRHAATNGQFTCEGWQVRRVGTRFWSCAVITALRDERGDLIGFAKVIRDITHRKQLEMELCRQAEELALANRRKDEFLAMLSHELRNPLAPVLNSVQVLRRAPDDPSLVRFAGSMVERQVRHMARLIDDLLEVTRITHGKFRLRTERIDLATLAERVAESVRPLMQERKHRFVLQVQDRPIPAMADPVRLDQVLLNLLNNAAEFTEPGGNVLMSVAREGDEAVIRVQDDGVGIGPDLLPRVFDLFAQGDTSLDRGAGGLGIGLTLARRLVAMHGGTIGVSSGGCGHGSEFTVRLPALADDQAPVEAPGACDSPHRSLRMLVVDDNVDTATSLAILLQIHGHQVEVAHDGEVAAETALARPFDVILLDIGLPTIDGYEVSRRIRARADRKRPLLVGISGYGFDADRQRARDAGFDLYFVKPLDPQRLEKLLDQWSVDPRDHETVPG